MGRIRATLALATAPQEAARRHPDVPIQLDRPLDLFPEAGDAIDFAGFAGLVDRAAALLVGAGVLPGNRVLVVKRANFDVILLAFACARVGAVPILTHPDVGSTSLGLHVRRGEPAAIVTDAETESAGALDEVGAALPPRLYVGKPGRHGEALQDQPPGQLPDSLVPPRDAPQLITHSSGTTGVPKLVLHTVESFAGHAKPQVNFLRVVRLRDPYLTCVSPVHARAMSGMLTVLAVGLPLGFMTDPDPRNAERMLARVRPGIVETLPNAFIRWEETAEARPELLAQVRMFISSFDAAHPRTIRTLLAAGRPGARYLQAYGQTETGPLTIKLHRTGKGCADGRCVGRPMIGHTRLRISDEGNTRRLGRGQLGAIYGKSAGVTPAYLGQEDQRVDGWWAMGDVGVVSKRGCLHLYDRIVDQGSGVDSLLRAEDHILEEIRQLTEAVLIPVSDGPPVPLVCTRGDRPLDRAAWERATAGLPALAPPVQCRWEDVPHTATWKVKRLEVARKLASGELVRLDAR
ncbi:class I adenylate-forming enzyme family protein [Streptomyces sp. NPDC057702]|uniref:class I adenylate-forming enzyme family protein n=1 Tax=unclassified Streptomyces TaxID=2593676 RepID=UPI0036B1827C